MDIRDKKVLVIGLAVSGLQTVKVLHGLGAHVKANDLKSEVELKEAISAIKGPNVDFVGGHPSGLPTGQTCGYKPQYPDGFTHGAKD